MNNKRFRVSETQKELALAAAAEEGRTLRVSRKAKICLIREYYTFSTLADHSVYSQLSYSADANHLGRFRASIYQPSTPPPAATSEDLHKGEDHFFVEFHRKFVLLSHRDCLRSVFKGYLPRVQCILLMTGSSTGSGRVGRLDALVLHLSSMGRAWWSHESF